MARANKRLAFRFYRTASPASTSTSGHQVLEMPVQNPDSKTPLQKLPQWKSQQKSLWATVLEETRKLPGPTRGRDRTKITELFAEDGCSQAQAILDFLATANVGRTPVAEEEAASEASEWENREHEEQFALLREGDERLGGGVVLGRQFDFFF